MGIKVSSNYKRIHSVKTLPKGIQEELVAYSETVLEDSSYESDEDVRRKYGADPVTYIIANDVRKKEAMQRNEEPRRIQKAREAKGRSNFKNIADQILNEAADISLKAHGFSREMTDARRFGNQTVSQSQQDNAKAANQK
jgi:hypothetical protein